MMSGTSRRTRAGTRGFNSDRCRGGVTRRTGRQCRASDREFGRFEFTRHWNTGWFTSRNSRREHTSFTRSRRSPERLCSRILTLLGIGFAHWQDDGEARNGRTGLKIKMTRSTGNVFSDVGFSPEEAENLKIRADLLIDLQEALSRRRMKQAEAAKVLGVTQPRVSDLMRGRIELFSIDTMVNMLARLGIKVKVTVKASRRRAKVVLTRRFDDELPGRLAQLGRAPALQAGGHWFEPGTAHQVLPAPDASGPGARTRPQDGGRSPAGCPPAGHVLAGPWCSWLARRPVKP